MKPKYTTEDMREKALNVAGEYRNSKGHKRFAVSIDDCVDLLKAQQAELLDTIEKRLPEKKETPHVLRANECEVEGYNNAIDQLGAILETLRKELV